LLILRDEARGVLSKSKQQFREMQKLAGDDAKSTYLLLKRSMEAGEAWAHQIYWKNLCPKGFAEEAVKVKVPQSMGKDGVEEFKNEFMLSLQGFDDYTKEEVLQVIKVLNGVKEAENSSWAVDNLPQMILELKDVKKNKIKTKTGAKNAQAK
jgi:hypothetical protein